MWLQVDVEQQVEWAIEDGFDVWSDRCHECGEPVAEGDDCSEGHYGAWLAERIRQSLEG